MNHLQRDSDLMKNDIAAFLRAVELEADSEAAFYEGFGVVGEASKIPRVLSFLGIIKRHQKAINLFLPIVRWFYVLIFAPLLYSYSAVKEILNIKSWCSNSIEKYQRKELYLATSSGNNLAYLPEKKIAPDLIITNPYRGNIARSVLPDVPRISIFEFVSIIDFYRAWIRSVLANWYLLKLNKGRSVLWGYTAFEWFLLYGGLRRLEPKSIWVSNHYDRWLILALSIPGTIVNLVQHGRLFHTFPNGDQFNYKRNFKITGLNLIYALDKRSEILFSDYIESKKVIFYQLKTSIELMPWRREEQDHLKILVIGGSNRLEFYLSLMDAIRAAVAQPVALAIRHHPLQKKRLAELRSPINYWELSSEEPAPKPDLIVTYGSSIDDQLCIATHARFITYAWSERIDLHVIVKRVLDIINELS